MKVYQDWYLFGGVPFGGVYSQRDLSCVICGGVLCLFHIKMTSTPADVFENGLILRWHNFVICSCAQHAVCIAERRKDTKTCTSEKPTLAGLVHSRELVVV